MNTPKRRGSWLEHFPPDIWAYFVWYLPGEQLGRLLMTGSLFLLQRLKFPRVVKSIKLGEDFLVFKSLPAFLSKLPSLEELVIHSCNEEWSDKLGLQLDLLPLGLRKLELSGSWTEPAEKLFGEPNAILKLCDHLPRLETLNFCDFSVKDYSWVYYSPQTLTKLSLNFWNGKTELPSTLIDFEAKQVRLSKPFATKLPPALESFVVLDRAVGVKRVIPLLPPSIQKLGLGINPHLNTPFRLYLSQQLLKQLPRSLTWFQVSDSSYFRLKRNPELIAYLPLTLTELVLETQLPHTAWSLLPNMLTSLYFLHGEQSLEVRTITDNDGTQRKIESYPFGSLPRSITNLFMRSDGGEMYVAGPPSAPSPFPPHLTYLNIFYLELTPEVAQLLPSSLTFLKIDVFCDHVGQHLPKGLKTLASYRTEMSPNLIKLLPESLTKLSLRNPPSWFRSDPSEQFQYVTSQPQITISPAPSTRNNSSVDTINYGLWYTEFQLPNLIELSLEDYQHFSDLYIPLLPSCLTSLHLNYLKTVTGKSFPLLPRTLTRLNLNSAQSIFDSNLQHLPRTLKEIYFNKAIHLTNLCIPDLPRHLEMLSMKTNSQIHPTSFLSFPLPLRSSQRASTARFAHWQIDCGVIKPIVENGTLEGHFSRKQAPNI